MTTLDDQLLKAHAVGDLGALVRLYSQAAEDAAEQTARSFYLTHAYVFALELGCETAPDLRDKLIALGAETTLHSGMTSPR